MKLGKTVLGAVAAIVMTGMAQAQDPSGPTTAAMSKLRKIMGQQSMSAKAVMTFANSMGASKMGAMEFDMMMSKGKTRMEMDYAKMMATAGAKKGQLPAGMDKMVIITRPDKKVVYQVIPGFNAYAEMAIPDADGEKADSVKVSRKVEGAEKVDKFNCERVCNSVTSPDGTTTVVMTWEAKELGGLPVKIETVTPEGKMTMLFKDIKRDTPAASLFEPPAGATRYESKQQMMKGSMMKMMGQ